MDSFDLLQPYETKRGFSHTAVLMADDITIGYPDDSFICRKRLPLENRIN